MGGTFIQIKNKRILVVSPHVDDAEFWASGFIIAHGKDNQIRHIAFSTCEESLPEGFTKQDITREWEDAQEKMGIEDYKLYDYQVRHFPTHRQSILEHLVKEQKTFAPDIVVCSSDHDIHQDHAVIGVECQRAFFSSTLINYPTARSIGKFVLNMFFPPSIAVVNQKRAVMASFKSQMVKMPYDKRVIEIMEYYGSLYGVPYIEPFYIDKVVFK